MFEFFEHTADAGFRVRAGDLPELFRDAASALFSLIADNLEDVQPAEQRRFHLHGTEMDYLLFDWLSELLYLHETQGLVLNRFDVQLTADGLEADVSGEVFDPQRHRPLHEIKAVTYHDFDVKETDGGWEATVIVDI